MSIYHRLTLNAIFSVKEAKVESLCIQLCLCHINQKNNQ